MKNNSNADNMYYVYMLKCFTKHGKFKIYTGYAKDAWKRFAKHFKGIGCKFTSRYKGRVKMAYIENHNTRKSAMRREIDIKSMRRDEKLKLINTWTSNENS